MQPISQPPAASLVENTNTTELEEWQYQISNQVDTLYKLTKYINVTPEDIEVKLLPYLIFPKIK